MGWRSDYDTAVYKHGNDRFSAQISGAWNIDANPNGKRNAC